MLSREGSLTRSPRQTHTSRCDSVCLVPAREVCFVKYYQKGSTDIAADQMAVALQRRGIAARSLFAGELGSARDAVLVFIKRADLLDLLRARRRGNALVLDVQDTLVFKRGLRYGPL